MKNRDEKIEALHAAYENLENCISHLEDAVGDDANLKAYLIDQLRVHLDSNHGFLSKEKNIGDLIEEMEDGGAMCEECGEFLDVDIDKTDRGICDDCLGDEEE